jgi:hypothetical protein
MNSQTKILVLHRNEGILEIILRLINNHEDWYGVGESELDNLAHLLVNSHFDLVLIGSGFSNAEEQEIIKTSNELNPGIKIVHHWGGGSGLLTNEIMAALEGVEGGNYQISY